MCQPGRPGPISLSQNASPGLGSLPEREVPRIVFFVFVHIDPRPIFHSGEIAFGEFSVAGKS